MVDDPTVRRAPLLAAVAWGRALSAAAQVHGAPGVGPLEPSSLPVMTGKPARVAAKAAPTLWWHDGGVRRPLTVDAALDADFTPRVGMDETVLPRPRAAARNGRLNCLLLATAVLLFAGCGGSGDPPPAPLSAGAGYSLTYTLTNSSILTGSDPLLREQWHLQNVGQNGGLAGEDMRVLPAWTITRGAGVRVAVIDDAVELVHPDLLPNIVPGASYSYRSGNRGSIWPLPWSAAVDDHGTAVAGLVLARDDNAIGGAGVAPRASLVAYDALSSSLGVDIADALGRDAQLNAIYPNSWARPTTAGCSAPSPRSRRRSNAASPSTATASDRSTCFRPATAAATRPTPPATARSTTPTSTAT